MEVLSAIEHKSELVKKGEITPLDAMELDEIKDNLQQMLPPVYTFFPSHKQTARDISLQLH